MHSARNRPGNRRRNCCPAPDFETFESGAGETLLPGSTWSLEKNGLEAKPGSRRYVIYAAAVRTEPLIAPDRTFQEEPCVTREGHLLPGLCQVVEARPSFPVISNIQAVSSMA